MATPSNDVLEANFQNMLKQNNKEHKEVKQILTDLSKKFDNLDDRYPTRREVKAIASMIVIFSTVLGIVWFFISK